MSLSFIKLKAPELRSKYNIAEDKFAASDGWVHIVINLCDGHSSIRVYSEAGEVNKESVKDEMLKGFSKIVEVQARKYLQ